MFIKKFLLFFFFSAVIVNSTTINFNYFRFDNDYKDWNVWLWEEGNPGNSFEFNKNTSYGNLASINISDQTKRVGFIIRKGEWEKKDIDSDRYIDINNKVENLYLVSGDNTIYFKEEMVDKSNRINGALIIDDDLIKISTTIPVDIKKIKDEIFINDNDITIPVKDVFTSNDPNDRYFKFENNKVIIEFNPADFGITDSKKLEVFLVSSINSWKKEDKELKFIRKNKVFVLEREMGISKKQIATNTEFKFFVSDGVDERWFPDNNIVLKKQNELSNIFFIKTLKKLKPEIKYSVNITGLVQKTAIPYSMLDNYKFDDWLGYRVDKEKTIFRLWSPVSKKAFVRLFEDKSNFKDIEMIKKDNIFELIIKKDLKGKFYQYKMLQYEKEVITADPWCYFSGINGEKSFVGDLKSTDTDEFLNNKRPSYNKNIQNIILYEAHIRDLTVSKNSGVTKKGMFLGFGQKDTFLPDNKNIKTALSHIKELGITHIHILPVMDFASVDETKGGYNWGYDPSSYFALEGSYSEFPEDPNSRVSEFKQMISSIHEKGIGVILDVVYNHTFSGLDSSLSKTVPYYYYRISDKMEFGNGSGCGNETASEHFMFKKHIIDSMIFFVQEYKIDGFRFDLMALHDVHTMYEIEEKLNKVFPEVIIYGEPWNGGPSLLSENLKFYKGKQRGRKISVFNDSFRNAIKGDTDGMGKGYITGDYSKKNDVINGLFGAINEFAQYPSETINYVTCHDNLTLTDKIKKIYPNATLEEISKRATLANTFVMFAQGIPFIHSGVEILRSKDLNHNSYNAGDKVNAIKWEDKEKYFKVFTYYQEIIKLRKELNCFKYKDKKEILTNMKILDTPTHIIGIEYIDCDILLFFNVSETGTTINHKGNYKVLLNGLYSNSSKNMKNYITLPGLSALMLKREGF
ncbi:MAG: type I pullulanase [Candidatus Muirbacterium halophilum]|nr:type I pullulanase [Candidatus Muirbacterium halophilum]MCK9476271.1 type I pullulanase [Candidatus Muirbacterium halophilum]